MMMLVETLDTTPQINLLWLLTDSTESDICYYSSYWIYYYSFILVLRSCSDLVRGHHACGSGTSSGVQAVQLRREPH